MRAALPGAGRAGGPQDSAFPAQWDERFECVLRSCLPFPDVDVEFTADTDLRDLGLDSLGAVDLLGELERVYGVHCVDLILDAGRFTRVGPLWNAVCRGKRLRPAAA